VRYTTNVSSKKSKEEKSYEKDNLLGCHGFNFGFDGISELCPGIKNDGDKKQSAQSGRDMAGVDDL
jgi:hypothetical protein